MHPYPYLDVLDRSSMVCKSFVCTRAFVGTNRTSMGWSIIKTEMPLDVFLYSSVTPYSLLVRALCSTQGVTSSDHCFPRFKPVARSRDQSDNISPLLAPVPCTSQSFEWLTRNMPVRAFTSDIRQDKTVVEGWSRAVMWRVAQRLPVHGIPMMLKQWMTTIVQRIVRHPSICDVVSFIVHTFFGISISYKVKLLLRVFQIIIAPSPLSLPPSATLMSTGF